MDARTRKEGISSVGIRIRSTVSAELRPARWLGHNRSVLGCMEVQAVRVFCRYSCRLDTSGEVREVQDRRLFAPSLTVPLLLVQEA
uniref:Uncharacterized protein n=1 Tax=Chromera velia CCMP2878 TaxID=1169474 RepID=A0A0G4FQ00_9ALVE|eukprot:Cvel_18185.t1-p1 / transcript=Cvel_18185.t1 / gene=Cvel_18185 / organism=Chromera_velia_CCMP2878 / gene_product=hypothetical protein / transcript_product=hypothetical protein / location=Cvel_scaffold1492:1866-3459(+) / protein_length=85 / sequence_SO=supercontig / SO=protein_coding / is_pseudo=false